MNPITALNICEASYEQKTGVVREVEYLIEDIPQGRVIAFRGTEGSALLSGGGWLDLLRDLFAIPLDDHRVGTAHAGFLLGARSVCDDHLIPRYDRRIPTWITGHSLGGGLGICAAPILIAAGWNIRGVVTFGAPLAISSRSARDYPLIPVQQFANHGDPVTWVPPVGFSHIDKTRIGPRRYFPSIMKNHVLSAYRTSVEAL